MRTCQQNTQCFFSFAWKQRHVMEHRFSTYTRFIAVPSSKAVIEAATSSGHQSATSLDSSMTAGYGERTCDTSVRPLLDTWSWFQLFVPWVISLQQVPLLRWNDLSFASKCSFVSKRQAEAAVASSTMTERMLRKQNFLAQLQRRVPLGQCNLQSTSAAQAL